MTPEWAGMVLAGVTFTTIGMGHILVRKLHARFRTAPAIPLFLAGLLVLYVSLQSASDLLSSILGITAVTLAWDGIEIYRQEKRMMERTRDKG